MTTNLEIFAKNMSEKIKNDGLDSYHWSEVSTVIDELLKYADFGKSIDGYLHVGYTNGANIKMLINTDYGAMYSDTKQDCYIPLYMLSGHAHRIELTGGDKETAMELNKNESNNKKRP